MKKLAEKHLGNEVIRSATITFPGKCVVAIVLIFDKGEMKYLARDATKMIAESIGIGDVSMIPEPSAAALYYICTFKDKILKELQTKKTLYAMVFDLGGGTGDATLVRIFLDGDNKLNTFNEINSGDNHMGGLDIDSDMADNLCSKIRAEHLVDFTKSEYAVQYSTIKAEMQRIKENFSHNNPTVICFVLSLTDDQQPVLLKYLIPSSTGAPQHYSSIITRKEFDEVVNCNFLRRFQVLESKLISEASRRGITIDLKEVYIFKAGGSCKLTAIHDYLCTRYSQV
jgi:molecular chaperone DnaK (HSP70)